MTQDAHRPGILLSGYYGCGNLGDDLLLTVAVEELRAILPGARFLLRDHGAGVPELGPDVTPTGIDGILDDQTHPQLYRLAYYIWRISRLLRQSRWLIFGGGTVFHENGGLASLTLQWTVCHLARALGVRIAALGVGIADLRTPIGRWLLRGIIAHSELFLVRDQAALRQCTGTKARLTDDLVFAWRALRPAGAPPHPIGARLGIGLTVSPAAGERTTAALADAVRHWRQRGHRVVFLVFQRNAKMADDVTVFEAINERLDDSSAPIEIRRLAADAKSLTEAFADIDVVCGMRFHGLVLATMLARAFVGIVHDNKITEVCRRFAMPCYDAANLDGATLARGVEDVGELVPDPQLLKEAYNLAANNFYAFAARSS